MSSICLNMIVKNESHIIEQTLENICQYIQLDYWVIADTGSTDDTVQRIENFFAKKGIAGEIVHHEWKDFGTNRQLALDACAHKADYVFVFDADDQITGQFLLPKQLSHEAYLFKMMGEKGIQIYHRVLLFRNDIGFHWRGALHEFLTHSRSYQSYNVQGDYSIVSRRQGARSQNPRKYIEDAALLERVIAEGRDPDLLPRYTFYCAQSYHDAGDHAKAMEWYQKRIELKGWMQEVYISYMRLGLMYEGDSRHQDALMAWEAAVEIDPLRPEAWYHLSRRHTWNKQHHLALCFAERAQQVIWPKHRVMLLNREISEYWCHYEVCRNAFELKRYAQAYEAFKLVVKHAPQDLVKRVIHQLPFYKTDIQQDQFANVLHFAQNLKQKGFEKEAQQLLILLESGEVI